jgi:hypothetical protein
LLLQVVVVEPASLVVAVEQAVIELEQLEHLQEQI